MGEKMLFDGPEQKPAEQAAVSSSAEASVGASVEKSYEEFIALFGGEDEATDWVGVTSSFASAEEATRFVDKLRDKGLYVETAVARSPIDGRYYAARKSGGKLKNSRHSTGR